MIWSLVSKSEMDGFGTSPVFRFYREALGKENISLAVVEENDELNFVKEDDVVLLRTAHPQLLATIERKGLRSTAENYPSYKLVSDKVALAQYLMAHDVNVPKQFALEDVEDEKTYFVKPRFGCDSFGISTANICRSKYEVEVMYERIKNVLNMEPVIEEFIEGEDCTVACCVPCVGELLTAAIGVECEETDGIQTRDCKVGFKEYCHAMENTEELDGLAEEVFVLLKLKHHARMDFRRDKDGNVFLIDVNLLPGLGPVDHFAKCFLLTKNFSYVDTMKMIVVSALV